MQYACIHGLSALACAKLHNFSKDAHHLTRKIPPLTKFFFNGGIDYLSGDSSVISSLQGHR